MAGTPWDVSTGSYASKTLSVTTQESTPQGVALSSDGTKAYVVGYTNNTVYQYTLSTAWDISTGTYASKSMSVSTQDTFVVDLSLSSDGTKCYILGANTSTVYQYTLSTPWDISTGSYASKQFVLGGTYSNSPQGLTFSTDGTHCYVVDTIDDRILDLRMSVAWDVSTLPGAWSALSGIGSQEASAQGVSLSIDGTKMLYSRDY